MNDLQFALLRAGLVTENQVHKVIREQAQAEAKNKNKERTLDVRSSESEHTK